jgi:hypothetical protein
VAGSGYPVPVSVKDDLLSDLPKVYPGLSRPEIERLLTLLDEGASTEGAISLSIATAIKPLVPDVAERLASYKDKDADEYLRMLRGTAVLLLQQWQPEGAPPAPDAIAHMVETIESDA